MKVCLLPWGFIKECLGPTDSLNGRVQKELFSAMAPLHPMQLTIEKSAPKKSVISTSGSLTAKLNVLVEPVSSA